MDIPTATPAEIDGEIARIRIEIGRVVQRANLVADSISRLEKDDIYGPRRIPALHAELKDLNVREDALRGELAPYSLEYAARGGWTRYFLVNNSTGHVHSSMECSTCFVSTEYRWLTGESGKSAEDLVELAGERACTVCFPWAPVDALKRASAFRSDSEEAAIARAKKRAEAAEAKATKAITNPDGTPLEISVSGMRPEVIKTERAAAIEVVDQLWYQKYYSDPQEREATVVQLLAALAAKRGTSVEEERAAAEKRLVARIKREG